MRISSAKSLDRHDGDSTDSQFIRINKVDTKRKHPETEITPNG